MTGGIPGNGRRRWDYYSKNSNPLNEPAEQDNFDEEGFYLGEEDVSSEEQRLPGPLSLFPARRHLLPAIILVIIFYISSTLYSKYPAGDLLWVSGEAVFTGGEYWRLLTSLAVHADIVHLMSNALLFVIFGWMLRAYFGFMLFPVVSTGVGVLTNLITVYFYEPHIKLIGASGMAFGMVAIWLVFYMKYDSDRPLAVRIFRAMGFSLVMLVPSTVEPQVSYMAHGAGFVCGFFSALLLLRFVPVRDPS